MLRDENEQTNNKKDSKKSKYKIKWNKKMKISFVKCQDMRKHTTLLATIFPFRWRQFYFEDDDFFLTINFFDTILNCQS